MRPREARVAVLDGYELRFDLPVGPGERGVANVRALPGARVWGVAYRISAPEFDRLDRTEGVHRGAYRRQPVTLRAGDREALAAFTYCSVHGRDGRKPSRRYLALLLAGARHHGLPADWVARLRAFELAHDERDPQLELPT